MINEEVKNKIRAFILFVRNNSFSITSASLDFPEIDIHITIKIKPEKMKEVTLRHFYNELSFNVRYTQDLEHETLKYIEILKNDFKEQQ